MSPRREVRQLDEDLLVELPGGADVHIEVVETTDGSSSVLQEPETVEEALGGVDGLGVLLHISGSLGRGNRDIALRLPRASAGDKYVAVAIDEDGMPYLAGMPVVADSGETRLSVRLAAVARDEGDQGEESVLISPRRVTKLWLKKVLGLPVRELGLFGAVEKGGGALSYEACPVVGADERVALVVHGALSEFGAMEGLTRYLLGCDRYDRVLGFEYETVATQIATNGEALATALRGVGARRERSVDVFAYSMGSQVARSFVELSGGGEIVGRAILIAPPNGGTQLAVDEDRLLKLGSMLVSRIPGWLGSVLGVLFHAVELKDQGLDDLKPGSAFYHRLAAEGSPWREAYKTIAGVDDESPRFLKRLLGSAAGAYFGEQNDWVVPLSSTESGPVEPPEVVAANHFSFFDEDCFAIDHLLDEWTP